jgi:hypothetical protein
MPRCADRGQATIASATGSMQRVGIVQNAEPKASKSFRHAMLPAPDSAIWVVPVEVRVEADVESALLLPESQSRG